MANISSITKTKKNIFRTISLRGNESSGKLIHNTVVYTLSVNSG